jgi:hypothetical protein
VKAEAERQRRTDTEGIVGDARGQVRRFCFVRQDEVPRLDDLARKLRSLNGENTDRIQRPDLLSALLSSGLDLAESKTKTLGIFPGFGVRHEYRLKLADVGRVKRLLWSLWPSPKGRPLMGYFHGALIRLALQAAETDKIFESKLASRLLRASPCLTDAERDSCAALEGSCVGMVKRGRKPNQ